MKVENVLIADLKKFDRNPRIMPKRMAEALARSLDRYGMVQPLVVNKRDNAIVAGHQRLDAAATLGHEKVPVVFVDLDKTDATALNIALNKIEGEWDMEQLSELLGELGEADFDLELLGFSTEELESALGAMGTEGLTDPDAVPLPPDKAVSRRGEVYALGRHRLMCGDSSVAEDVDRLLDGVPIQLVNTDPPYNVQVAPRSNAAVAVARANGRFTGSQGMDVGVEGVEKASRTAQKKLRAKDRPLINDFVTDEEFARLLRAWFGNARRVLEPGRAFYIWGGYSNIWNYPNALKECELYFSQMIIWVKEHPVLTRKDFMGNHEWCFYGWREGKAHKFFGPNNATDVWSVKKINPQAMVHLTEKPVELAVRAIHYSSRKGENVLDLFGGSGSTLIACEQTERRAHLMEIDGPYCDVIRKRWAEFVHGEGCDWQTLTPVAR